ncbi:MAG TPA: hypothetical protein VKP30_09490 [Polyangiaceae bacterium]|nr:hypothetical protein [Polyangiaceae bacterium]
MVNSSASGHPECASTVNAQMCGFMAHRACMAADYVTGWYVSESPDGRATMQAMCVK